MNDQLDRLPPHSIDAEMSVLGSIMLEPSRLDEIRSVPLVAEDFYQPDHRLIFDALCATTDIDAVSVRATLASRGQLADCGGSAYLAKVLYSVPSAAHAKHYAKIVREKSILRRQIDVANEVLRACYEPRGESDAASIAISAAARFADLSAGAGFKVHRIGDVAREVLANIGAGSTRRQLTGLYNLDQITGGLPVGGFTLIAGRPGMGKSLLVKQIMLSAARSGIPVGLVTVEESRFKVGENAISNESGIENNHIAFGAIDAMEWTVVEQAAVSLDSLPYYVIEEPQKLSDVCAAVTTLAIRQKCRIIAVDYLQLIEGPDRENKTQEVTKISNALKLTFKRLGVCGVAAAQLNRGSETTKQRPTLANLRESGALEQDGDLILLLHSDDYHRRQHGEDKRDQKLLAIVGKNKDGACGDVLLYQDNKTQLIRDWSEADAVPDFD